MDRLRLKALGHLLTYLSAASIAVGCFISINDYDATPESLGDASAGTTGAGGSTVGGTGGAGANGVGGTATGGTQSGGASSGGGVNTGADAGVDDPDAADDGGPTNDGSAPGPEGGTGACPVDTFRCAGPAQQGIQRCDGQEWVSNGNCTAADLCNSELPDTVSDRCDPIVSQCLGKSPGDIVCTGANSSVLTRCGPDLVTLETIQDCGSTRLCAAAVSDICPLCETGEYRCSGALLQSCGAGNSSWDDVTTCSTADLCNAGAGACTSAACNPNQHTCSGSWLQVCNAGQTGFDNVDNCGSPSLCDGINGQCDVCVPGTMQCSGNYSQTCSSNGQSWNSTLCTTCTGQGVCCIAGTEVCDGADNNCNNQVDEGYNIGTPCDGADGDYCNEGSITCGGCTDGTGTNSEVCGGGDEDCDSTANEPGAVNCQYYYVDADGDGYGDSNQGQCLCGPSGSYTTPSPGDCCDGDWWARPGRTFDPAYVGEFARSTNCGGWDFDCDGYWTKVAPDGSGINPDQCANNCNHTPGWDTLFGCPRGCGESGHWINQWDIFCGVTGYMTVAQPCL